MLESGDMIGYESLDLAGRYCLPNLATLAEVLPEHVPQLS